MATFDQQILAALAGPLHPDRFEECACDLLRDVFPGLFPIRGGGDAGMDGGIADGKGEPYPLVCTTAKDVKRNLTKNLQSYLENGGSRRRVVLATSQKVTGPSATKLRDQARELGFKLMGIYDRHAIKDRLYKNSTWCQSLLELTGTPSALSTVPRSNRPSPEIGLVGREADLDWLKSTPGNRLLVGQPGSGKTFLLRCLVREGRGLFLVDQDRTEISNALREEGPEAVIVDDAHRDPGTLEMLLHLRDDLGKEQGAPTFSIVATCWPGEENQIRAALRSLPTQQVHRLELMTRKEILQVIEQLLSGWSEKLLRVLVNQASNKPGIAATLAWLCLRGDWREVVSGQALWSNLEPTFKELVGPEASDFLGALSLSGQAGMTPEVAGEFLGWDRQKAREKAIGLAAGGVLTDLRDRRLVVQPADLRSALLRRTFFEGPAPLPYRELLDKVPDRDSSIFEIVRVAHLETKILPQELRDLVRSTEDRDVWRALAALEGHSIWALENAPVDAVYLAREALSRAPGPAVRLLLERAVGVPGPLHSKSEHPLRVLQDWLQEPVEDARELMPRRRQTLYEAQKFVGRGGDYSVAVHAACLALSPSVEGFRTSPVGDGFLSWGTLPLQAMNEVSSLWPQARDMIQSLDAAIWPYLRDLVQQWTMLDGPGEVEKAAHGIVSMFLKDLTPLAGSGLGMLAELRNFARCVGCDLELKIDPPFELLYLDISEDVAHLERHDEEKREAIRRLASDWALLREPRDVAQTLLQYERESSWLSYSSGPWAETLCSFMAEIAQPPVLWLEAFLDEQAPAAFVLPFLERTARDRPEGWLNLANRCFRNENQIQAAVQVVLKLSDPSTDLLEKAFSHVSLWPSLVLTLASRGHLPIATLMALLRHSDWEVGFHAAIGEWRAVPRGHVRPELLADWRFAVLRSGEKGERKHPSLGSYMLKEILARDAELACEWLAKRLGNNKTTSFFGFQDRDVEAVAIDALGDQQRLILLDQIRAGPMASAVLSRLIQRRPDLYRELLGKDRLKAYHLHPLQGFPDASWANIALVALEHDHDPAAIAETSFSGGHDHDPAAVTEVSVLADQFSHGTGRDYYRRWGNAFAALERHADARLHEVARIGRQLAQKLTREVGDRK